MFLISKIHPLSLVTQGLWVDWESWKREVCTGSKVLYYRVISTLNSFIKQTSHLI